MLVSGLMSCVAKLSEHLVSEEEEEMGPYSKYGILSLLWLACVGHE